MQWAGWAVEDQSWIPRANFGGDAQIKLFDEHNDPFRDIPEDSILPIDDLVHKDDLETALAAGRKRKRRSSGSNRQSSGGSARMLDRRRAQTQSSSYPAVTRAGCPPTPTCSSKPQKRPPPMRSAVVEWDQAASIQNPVLGDEIIVGSWVNSPRINGVGPNAVVAVFDQRGHLNYRIVARTVDGTVISAPTATSISLSNINLRWPYAGLSSNRLRAMIDEHLRLPRYQRP